MKLTRPVAVVVTALSFVALSNLPAAATTPLSGELNAIANSAINSDAETDLDDQSWSAIPTGLSTSVTVTSTNVNDFVTTSGSATASWSSADAGAVDFANYGWTYSVNDPSSTTSESDLAYGRGGDGDDWSYTFTATENGEIILNYNSSLASGNGFGLLGWSVDFTGTGTGYPVLSALDPTQSGVFTGQLVAGQTYTIGLSGNPNIYVRGQIGDYSGYMNGDFSWSIVGSPVPEPSTWLMLGLGFAGLGLVGYRRAKANPGFTPV